MVLSDIFTCTCFPCYPFKVLLYREKFNDEALVCIVLDDDAWDFCKDYLDNKVIEIDFQHISVLISDKKEHT